MLPEDNSLSRLANIAAEQLDAETKVANLEAELAQAKENLRRLQEEILPNAMAECGMSEFSLTNGAKISIKSVYYGSIAKERNVDAIAWLRANGFGALVKNNVVLSYGKGEDAKAGKVLEELMEAGHHPSHLQSVHPQTLKAWVREMMEQGKQFPMELFGAGAIKTSVIVLPKKD